MIMPGVVGHAKHRRASRTGGAPDLQFCRGGRTGKCDGGTDCGLGNRVHDELVWAKLSALVEGARLASNSLGPLTHEVDMIGRDD
jgi:5-methyltetrahydropteroyltriglutamate--homocysteine methyltransferase